MGNVNEKSTLDRGKPDHGDIPLNTEGYFDPWTETSVRTKTPGPVKGEGESEVSGNTSLPSSGSIIPETSEAVREPVFPSPEATLHVACHETQGTAANEDHIMQSAGAIHDDTVRIHSRSSSHSVVSPVSHTDKYLRERNCLPLLQHDLPLRLRLDSNQNGSTAIIPFARNFEVQSVATSDCLSWASTEQHLQNLPLPLATNNPSIISQLNVHVPIAPHCPALYYPAREGQMEDTPAPSPPTLGLFTLDSVDDLEVKLRHINIAEDKIVATEELGTARSSVAPQAFIQAHEHEGSSYSAARSTFALPEGPFIISHSQPYTMPFSTFEIAGLFVTEEPALGNPSSGPVTPGSVNNIQVDTLMPPQPPVSHVYAGTSETAKVVAQSQLNSTRISGENAEGEKTHGNYGSPLEPPVETQRLHPKTTLLSGPSVELLSNPPIDNQSPSTDAAASGQSVTNTPNTYFAFEHTLRFECRAAKITEKESLSVPDQQTIIANPDSRSSVVVVPVIVDVPNTALRQTETTKEILQQPLKDIPPSPITNQFVVKLRDRGGAEHTPDRPNWAKAPSEGDNPLSTSTQTSCVETLQSNYGHFNHPDLPEVPIPDPSSAQRIGRYRNRDRRRAKKERRGNISMGSARAIVANSLTQSDPANAMTVELETGTIRESAPPLQRVSTAGRPKIGGNFHNVSKWISDSASVIGSGESPTAQNLVAASYSSLMDSVSDQFSTMNLEGPVDSEKDFLPPAARITNTLTARDALRKEIDNPASYDQNEPQAIATDQFSAATAEEYVEVSSRPPAGLGKLIYKAEKSVIDLSPTCRQKRASIASSVTSGVSARSSVSTSSRLFQRAVQGIGPRQSLPGSYGDVHRALIVHEEPQITDLTPMFLSGNIPKREGATAITISVVTPRALNVTTPSLGGGVIAPPHEVNEAKNPERLMFNFKAPDGRHASIVNENQNAQPGLQLGGVRAGFDAKGGRIPRRATSIRSFIPRGKYIGPPICDGQLSCPEQVAVSQVTSRGGRTTQVSQHAMIAPAGTQLLDPPDDAYTQKQFQMRTAADFDGQFVPSVLPADSMLFSSHHQNLTASTSPLPDTMLLEFQDDPQKFFKVQSRGPTRQLSGYMTGFSLAKKVQHKMVDLAAPTHEYGGAETFDPTVRNNQHQAPGNGRNPTQPVAHNALEEYCRQQRKETRTTYEKMPSKLPRRKM